MEKRKWVAPNDLITLKKPKRPRTVATTRQQSSIPVSSSTPCDMVVGEDSRGSDWQLKSKVRILCLQDFVWLDSCKPQHEARALARLKSEDEDARVLFHQSLMVWMHPFFPFFDLFPRMGPQISNTQQEAFILSERQLGLMKEHWSSSFHSLFEVLHNGHCPYFYLCANSTTILFLAGSEASPSLALLTPTTSGFRRALTQQGVPFSLPFCSAKESHMMQEVEGADNWLKDMVAPDTPLSVISPIVGSGGSHLANSLVAVGCLHFRALVNFILNSKLLVSNEGIYAGIPPTLLAPTPFLGATINSLKVKRSHVMEASSENGTLTKNYCLDITGPILPQNTDLLRKLLDQSHPKYKMQSHVDGTSAFNQYFIDKKM